jgi:predicted nucleic acid-binding protein
LVINPLHISGKTNAERLEAIDRPETNSLVHFPRTVVNACRDPKDNKFLELALAAGCILHYQRRPGLAYFKPV